MKLSPQLKNILPVLLLSILIFSNKSCGTKAFGLHADSLFLVTDQVDIYYDLKRPDDKYFLPYVLAEISGLSHRAPNYLLAVDDETGKIFEFDYNKEDIVHSIEFGKADDYEGVELVGDWVYVLKSDGDVFKFLYTKEKKSIGEKIENNLGRKNDTEGLGYDPRSNNLLIACKEEGGLDEEKVKGRAFYTFDIESNELREDPIFSISKKNLERFWEKNRAFDYEESRIKFKPSAIAFHPIDKNYYVLSSVGKLIVVVNKSGKIKATYPISPRVLGQPEGICFSPTGEMFISSEGEGDRGYILKFSMKTK